MKASAPHAIQIEHQRARRSRRDPGALAPEPPCTGCRFAVTCRAQQLACTAFLQYIEFGQWKARPALRLPTRQPYRRVFGYRSHG